MMELTIQLTQEDLTRSDLMPVIKTLLLLHMTEEKNTDISKVLKNEPTGESESLQEQAVPQEQEASEEETCTLEELQQAMLALVKRKNKAAAREVLNKFGVTAASMLEPKDYGKVLRALREVD